MNKETLKEAAKEFYPPSTTDLICSPKLVRDAFIAGAKWQAERMYSEEDLRKAIQLARLCTLDKQVGDFVDLSGLTEVCTYGLEETHSEDSIIGQLKNK